MLATRVLLEMLVRCQARLGGGDRERGDVPGWVLITLMTAGLVTVIWTFAGGRLVDIVQGALDNVAPSSP